VSQVIEGATRGWDEEVLDTRRKQHPEVYTKVKVFYATDRKITEDAEYVGERSVLRGLHYGLVVVGIPNVHKPGFVEAPTCNIEEANPLKHVVILSIDTTLRDDTTGFIRKINRELDQEGSRFEHNILLYIHGYNVHHKDAIKRAAQLKYDLQLEGVVIVYSWPSKGTLWGYQHDEEVVKHTASCLQSFIQTILSKQVCSDAKVHILAHSMGNRALINALQGFQCRHHSLPQPMGSLKNIIFAAADETRTKFENMVTSLCIGTEGAEDPPQITVYSSICDIALHTSKMIHWKVRLGDTRSLFERSHCGDHSMKYPPDVVDASGVDASRLHHSYYGDVPEVIKDIQDLLTPFSAQARARRQMQ
jgi:esterase/lipase superfamily enzyme